MKQLLGGEKQKTLGLVMETLNPANPRQTFTFTFKAPGGKREQGGKCYSLLAIYPSDIRLLKGITPADGPTQQKVVFCFFVRLVPTPVGTLLEL